MGLNYSLGITFNNEKDANFCFSEFQNQKITLPNGNFVKLFPSVSEYAYNNESEGPIYVLCVLVNGLGNVDIDLSLFEISNYYTIRDFFHQYINNLKVDFEFAHFELEAADYLICAEDMTDDIAFLIKSSSEGDENLQKVTGIDKFKFLSKRYIDGIVIHSKNYSKLTTNTQSEFQNFKPNYYWLPIKEFKISK